MTGSELRAIRLALGLSRIEWGRALGSSGKDASVAIVVSRWELSPIVPMHVARLAAMYQRHGIPEDAA